MDWEANLAAIIKCTDANLEQQFRHFEDITTGYSAGSGAAGVLSPSDADGNVAAAYLRETMAADYHRAQQQQPQQQPQHQQTPSYSRVSSAFPTPTSSFSGHFHRRQERNRGTPVKDNQRADRGGREREPMGGEGQMHDYDGDDGRFAPTRPSGGSGMHHMYTSPTYDMAQMMEQVRLSLKLEVDARAAIAERQLSALLQLCKATSEELDRLRVEVCANDRQLHTLDQTQSKIRQELTTQKDIGFHLQSMCGKDESWRMQAENQLLELRQMVAALREQGNSTQAVAQEKLSRSELLVQFNAAMEPIKAQLQANLQHQAQQIAEVTRTTSSSSLLLDGLTQKVNRGLTDEISELRSDLNALKHHVAKIDIFQDSRGVHYDKLQRSSSSPHSKEQKEARAKEEQIEQGKKMQEMHDGLVKSVMVLAKDYTDAQTKQIHQLIEDNASRAANKGELETLQRLHGSDTENRIKQVEKQVESTMTTLQKDTQTTAAALAATVKSQCDNDGVEWEQKLKRLEETIAKTNLELSSLSNSMASLTARHSAAPINGSCNKEVDSALEKQVSTIQSTPPPQSSVDEHDEEEDVEEDEDEDDEDEEEDQLTLAQGNPDHASDMTAGYVYPLTFCFLMQTRFQQRQCNGEMLLELTESDLINDFGVQNRLDRERILNAIEAIKTSDVFSDDEEEDEDDDEGDGDGSEGEEDSGEDGNGMGAPSATDTHAGPRHSFGGGTTTLELIVTRNIDN
ncbi:hypothetical protein BBJ28_00000658 [Nothophytophthora sp. Chile5]|nr:hypothetical protein BBJ28_00000658 [Nothophytophthora sp. Chile5]